MLPTIDYRQVENFQGDLKVLDKENYLKLRNSIVSQGLLAPFYIWLNPSNKLLYLIDGHQRKRMFTLENVEPYLIPYVMVPGKTASEAKMNLLAISSQYGTITDSGFKKFSFDIPEVWIKETINFDALAKPFKVEFTPKQKEVKPVEEESFYLNIKCTDEVHCKTLYEKFVAEGLEVKIVT